VCWIEITAACCFTDGVNEDFIEKENQFFSGVRTTYRHSYGETFEVLRIDRKNLIKSVNITIDLAHYLYSQP